MEKCYDPQDATLEFVDGEDDLDFMCCNYKSLRAKMSCGHVVTPMSLTDYCLWLLNKGEKRFVCGQPHCEVEWPYSEVCKMALLTPEEKQHFENKLFSNATNDMDIKACPGCKSLVSRLDPTNLCVTCTVCTADRGRTYQFCWQCLRKWKGPGPRSDRCDNDGCTNQQLDTLKNCPDIVFEDVRGVTGCPSVRACPTCGLLVEHDKTQCKNIVCPRCKKEFCFVCLELTDKCLRLQEIRGQREEPDEHEGEEEPDEREELSGGWDSLSEDSSYDEEPYYVLCSSGVAPRQTSIPVWKKK